MRACWLGIGMGIGLLSCGGSGTAGHVEISGKTPVEGAAIAARAVCTQAARCGSVTITCMGGGGAGGSGSDAAPTMSCMATINPVAYDDCYADASGAIADLLGCPALTPEQINTLEVCFDSLATVKCTTQAEADAVARANETGGQPPRPDPPAACSLLGSPPSGC